MLNPTSTTRPAGVGRGLAQAVGLAWLALALLLSARPARAIDLTAGTEAELNTALAAANAAGPGTHTITLTADITLTDKTTAVDNPAATALILDGDGHTIDGHGHGPILSIDPGTTARVRDVTLTGGQALFGGAIYNRGALTVENSALSDNTADWSGGAIKSDGDVTILGSNLNDNSAGDGGAVVLTTEAITATLIIRNSAIMNNTAGASGGGVFVLSSQGGAAEVTINSIVVQGNESIAGTGGIELVAAAGSSLEGDIRGSQLVDNVGYRGGLALLAGGTAEVNVIGSAVARNVSKGGQDDSIEATAGGVYVRSNTGGTTRVTLFNSTLSGNSTGRAGGGLLVVANGGAAGANVVYSTLAENTSATGGGGIHTTAANGGVASVRLSASIISNGAGAGPDCARPGGAIISTGFNLAGDGTCFLSQDSDWPAAPAGLRPLALNAPGSTPTHVLNFSSPARDRLPPGALGCGSAITTDQRGVARPQPAGGRCDIGAFERRPGETPEFGGFLPVIRGSVGQ